MTGRRLMTAEMEAIYEADMPMLTAHNTPNESAGLDMFCEIVKDRVLGGPALDQAGVDWINEIAREHLGADVLILKSKP